MKQMESWAKQVTYTTRPSVRQAKVTAERWKVTRRRSGSKAKPVAGCEREHRDSVEVTLQRSEIFLTCHTCHKNCVPVFDFGAKKSGTFLHDHDAKRNPLLAR